MRRKQLIVSVLAGLLLVTVLNAYLFNQWHQRQARHIHVNKNLSPPLSPSLSPPISPTLSPSVSPISLPTISPPISPTSSVSPDSPSSNNNDNQDNNDNSDNNDDINNNNNNNNNTDNNNNNNDNTEDKEEDNTTYSNATTIHTASYTFLKRLKLTWQTQGTRQDKRSKYPRDVCLPRPLSPSLSPSHSLLLRLPLTVVTAASEGYVGHVHNLIGSVHTHQPDAEIAVYNLGFSEDSLKDLQNYCGVTVREFNFSSVPQHVTSLKNFAWKALVVKQALLDYGKILYLDSGVEIRRPLDFIQGRIERDGYFCIGMGDSLTRGGREGMFNFYNNSILQYLGMPMVASRAQGATFWGGAYEGIYVPAAECSLSASCITPARPRDELRLFGKDQVMLSSRVYSGGCVQCAIDNHFTAQSSPSLSSLSDDPFVAGKQQLFLRKGSGPFKGKGKRKSTCPDRKLTNYHKWQSMRDNFNTTFLGNGGCPHTRFQDDSDQFYGDIHENVEQAVTKIRNSEMAICTAGTSKEFAKIQELLDSVAKWEPTRKIVVFDLGFDLDQVENLLKIQNVEVEKFDFASYPEHVMDTKNMAWKVMAWAHMIQSYGSFLFLSYSHVLYHKLDSLVYQLMNDGIFSATVGGNMLDLFNDTDTAIKFFGSWPAAAKDRRADGGETLMKEFEYKPVCTASITGFWKDSKAANLVLPPLYDCAVDTTCWSNSVNSVKDYQNAEKLQLSLMIYDKICYTCNRDYDFYAYSGLRQSIQRDSKINLLEFSLKDEVHVVYDTIT